jgi:HlyD family secretion protein
MNANPKFRGRSLRLHVLATAGTVVLLVGGVGGWAATAELSGAVVAAGNLVVDTNVKKVQHPTGGVVGELRVRDGDRVKAGDILVRLDETQTRANLGIIESSIDELGARQARLEAERDSRATVTFSGDLKSRARQAGVGEILDGELKLFESRRTARSGQKAQLKERIGQLAEQLQGLAEQTEAKRQEIDLIRRELEGVRELWRKNLIQIQRVTALERDAARLVGERGSLVASIAQTKVKITETELQILQIDQDLRSEVGKELSEIRAKLAELKERRISAVDQLKRIDIRSPQDGTVHQLAVHTVGGVITAGGEPLMLIVPESDALTVEAKIAPQDIDQLRVGQPALLRLSAFNQRTTPEINGEVTRVSADLSTDQRSGTSFYTVRVSIPEHEVGRLNGLKLVPGMPVESFINTGERTVLSYLAKPLSDQLARAWRER